MVGISHLRNNTASPAHRHRRHHAPRATVQREGLGGQLESQQPSVVSLAAGTRARGLPRAYLLGGSPPKPQDVKDDALTKSRLGRRWLPKRGGGVLHEEGAESMGNVTSYRSLGFCFPTISSACSMLCACTITPKRAVPFLTWTETLTISLHLPY